MLPKPDKCKGSAVHCKREAYDVYIGRPSKWGNPFKIGMFYRGRTLTRDDAIKAFEDWLLNSDAGIELQMSLKELKGKTLGCWCKPLPCHGDILADLANAIEA